MAEFTINAQDLLPYVIYPIVVAIALLIIRYVKSKFSCIDTLNARSLRQSHALLLMSQRQDSITDALHPDAETKSDLGKLVDSALRDEKGNL